MFGDKLELPRNGRIVLYISDYKVTRAEVLEPENIWSRYRTLLSCISGSDMWTCIAMMFPLSVWNVNTGGLKLIELT